MTCYKLDPVLSQKLIPYNMNRNISKWKMKMNSSKNGIIWYCPKCPKLFYEEFFQQRHFIKIHVRKQCKDIPQDLEPTCLKPKQKEIQKVAAQKKKYVQGQPFMAKCKVCKQEFYKEKAFTLHEKECSSSVIATRKFQCKICSKVLTSAHSLQYHVAHRHKPKDITKGQTGRSSPAKKLKLNEEVNELRCTMCSELFKDLIMLQRHERTHSSYSRKNAAAIPTSKGSDAKKASVDDVKKQWKCEICSKGFALSCNLSRHVILVHKRPPKTFLCYFCLKSFGNSFILRRHMSIHTGEGQYYCSKCNKNFYTRSSLKTHLKYHATRSKTGSHFGQNGNSANAMIKGVKGAGDGNCSTMNGKSHRTVSTLDQGKKMGMSRRSSILSNHDSHRKKTSSSESKGNGGNSVDGIDGLRVNCSDQSKSEEKTEENCNLSKDLRNEKTDIMIVQSDDSNIAGIRKEKDESKRNKINGLSTAFSSDKLKAEHVSSKMKKCNENSEKGGTVSMDGDAERKKCLYCKEEFATDSELNDHLVASHSKEDMLKCNKCNILCTNAKDFLSHKHYKGYGYLECVVLISEKDRNNAVEHIATHPRSRSINN